MTAAITSIETWACDVPLERPVEVGRMLLRKRSHLAIRIRAADGLTAECVTQTRGSPLDVVVAEVIAPRIIGRDALDPAALRAQLRQDLVAMEFDGAVGRAWSAVEICLQDLRAQAARLPLWRLLGARRATPVPVLIVEGYALAGETDEAFADRLAARAAEGYANLKIEAGHYRDPAELLRRLELFRQRCDAHCKLILDFAWSWNDAEANLTLAREAAAFGLEWLEDPLPRTDVAGYGFLRQNGGVAIGCGDEASRPGDLMALLDAAALDVVRADATTIGGIEALREVTLAAQQRNVRASYHEHPEVHEHCVFGLGVADCIEMFPTDRPFDRVHELIRNSPYERVRNGQLAPPVEAGSGIKLREEAVRKYARRHLLVEA